jgi:hypothetical protein
MDVQTMNMLKKVSENYDLMGKIVDYTQCINGHINDTYRVKVKNESGKYEEYIFQRINEYVFKDPIKVMRNIKEVSLHVRSKKTECDCDIIQFLDNKDGKNYTCYEDGFWRICRYVENSVTHETAEDLKVLRSAGYAFGRFQCLLSDLSMDKLHETIPDFHNTKKRLNDFFEIVALDPISRVKEVKEEIKFFENNRLITSKLIDMQENGELPLRVTHNDTKYNNILMDKDTCEPLCVIDLDTVMPGLSTYDFGDAIRFAANTAMEDETDLSKVELDMKKYEEFAKGFITASKEFLTKEELDTMALGAIIITIELASRFLADHINGDRYFRIHRENHNLDRARCQIKLAQDMINKYDKMCNIVERYQ